MNVSRIAAEVTDLDGLARRAGVTYNTAKKWRARGLLPEPAGYVGGNPWWLWTAQLAPWLTSTGRA